MASSTFALEAGAASAGVSSSGGGSSALWGGGLDPAQPNAHNTNSPLAALANLVFRIPFVLCSGPRRRRASIADAAGGDTPLTGAADGRLGGARRWAPAREPVDPLA